MAQGNFLEHAESKLGIEVGFGKCILVYKQRNEILELSADTINADILAGYIIGVITGWHTVAGASVGEVSVERTGSNEMKMIREEIAADTISFESNMQNRAVLAELVKGGSYYCVLVDDLGNAFGDKSQNENAIYPALFNFSTKTTTSFQRDNTTDKIIAVTVRYLLKDLDVMEAGIETELIVTKSLVNAYISSIEANTSTSIILNMLIKNKANNKFYDGAIASGDLTVLANGAVVTSTTASYTAATGVLVLTLEGTGFSTTAQKLRIKISGDEVYMNEALFNLGEA